MKTVRTVIASNDVPYFQMRSVGSYSMSEMEKEERMGSMTLFIIDTFTTQTTEDKHAHWPRNCSILESAWV